MTATCSALLCSEVQRLATWAKAQMPRTSTDALCSERSCMRGMVDVCVRRKLLLQRGPNLHGAGQGLQQASDWLSI